MSLIALLAIVLLLTRTRRTRAGPGRTLLRPHHFRALRRRRRKSRPIWSD